MNRRRSGSLAGSPLLIGAVTTLIVVVAVFLSYNANNGLPFVPTYNIKVALPEASGLQPSNQVRIGGTRVGLVSSLTPHQDPATGRVTAIANLKLEKKVEPLPADTRAIVQSVSAIGLKYLELEKGTSHQTLKAGETIPITQVREPVEHRRAVQHVRRKDADRQPENMNNFGDGLAGRGLGLNNTIATLRPLLTNAIPVLRNLAAPPTGLRELFIALDRAASQSAPVAEANAAWYRDLDTFFTAWASVAPSLERATEGGPASLEQATHSLPVRGAVHWKRRRSSCTCCAPSASALRTVAPPLGHAVTVGAVNLKAATALNSQLASSAQALQAFAENPIVPVALEDFTQTLQIRQPGARRARPRAGHLQLLHAGVPQPGEPDLREHRPRHALPHEPRALPERAQQRGLPLLGAGQRAVDRTRLPQLGDHRQQPRPREPLPERRRPRSAGGNCEAGNESYLPGKAVIGNVPGATGTTHEVTTREQNLFGEKYPSATLKDLGVLPAKKTKRPRSTKEKRK